MKRVVTLLLGVFAMAGAAASSSSHAKYQPSPEEVLAALAHRSGLTEDALRGPLSNCDASQSAMNICAYRDAVAADLVDDLGKQRDDIAIAKAENGIQVHCRTALRHQAADHPLRGLAPEQRLRHLTDGLIGRTLAHADQDGAVADRHDVASLHRGVGELIV